MIRTNQSRSTHAPVITNEEIAQTLVDISDLLERQGANPYRIRAYRQGRLDQLDSVARQSPSMVGFAFNNRLLLGGFAGESNALAAGLNPLNDPAQENLTLLLLDAHRMLDLESAKLESIPAFVELFRQAFPDEARRFGLRAGQAPDFDRR